MNSPHRNLPRMMELPLRYTFAFSLGEARAQGKLDAGTLLPLRPGTRDDSQAAARWASGVCGCCYRDGRSEAVHGRWRRWRRCGAGKREPEPGCRNALKVRFGGGGMVESDANTKSNP